MYILKFAKSICKLDHAGNFCVDKGVTCFLQINIELMYSMQQLENTAGSADNSFTSLIIHID